MVLRVPLKPRANGELIVIHGELDQEHAPVLENRVDEALTDGVRSFVFDLGFCRFADSDGLGALLAVSRRITERGGSTVAVSPAPVIRRLLWASSIETILPVCWTREAAISALGGEAPAPALAAASAL